MKFNIKKSVLQEALQIAISAIPNKSTLQILNDYSLRLEGNTLEICATDLNLGVRIKLEVEGERDGEALINARKFSDLVKALVPSCESVSTATFWDVEARPCRVADVSICFCICLRV